VQMSAADRAAAADIAKLTGALGTSNKELDAARAKAGRARDALSGLGGAAAVAGKQFMDGLTNAIIRNTPASVAAAQGAANKVAAALNSPGGFDSRSPSKKGIQSGRWLVEGVAVGMKDATAGALKAAQALVDAISDRMDARLSKAVDRLSALRDKAKAAFETAAGGVGSFLDIGQIGQSIESEVTRSIIDPITGAVSSVTDRISTIPSAASLFTGFASSAVAFANALKTMADKKFPLSLITAVAGSGNLAAATSLANLDPTDTAKVIQSTSAIADAQKQAGGLLQGLTVDPKLIAAAVAQVAEDKKMVALLDRIDRKLGNLDKDTTVSATVEGDDLVVLVNRKNKQNARRK
jgi:hypothetical protein